MKQGVSFLEDTDGSVSMMMVILMFVFVGILAFVIDLAHLQTVKNELQNAADACALRGARAFLPDNIPPTGVYDVDPNQDNAKQEAFITISANRSDNVNFQVGDVPKVDIKTGIWNYETRSWVGGTPLWSWPPDSSLWGHYIGPGVSLPTRRNGANSLGPVAMTLAKFFGIPTVSVNAAATAALSGVGGFPEDYGTFPIAVDVDAVKSVGGIIYLSPDLGDVGGWTSLTSDTASAAVFKDLIDGIGSPAVKDGSTISLQNGVACTAIKEAIDRYVPSVQDPKGVYTPNNPPTVYFPGVQVDKFNQTATVEGGLAAKIIQIRDADAPKDIQIPNTNPPKYTGNCMLVLQIEKGVAPGTPAGGRWYGLLSTEPKLVQ